MTDEISDQEIVRWLKRIDAKLDRAVYKDVYDAETRAIKEDLKEVKSNQSWFGRTLILELFGLVITLAVALLALTGGPV
jgi:hypothetical protein